NPSCSGAQAPAQWVSPNSPVADQLSGLAAPAQPTNVPPGPTLVNSPLSVVSTPACPDEIGEGCEEFSPGYYPNGICVGAGCNYTNQPPKQAAVDIAIFDPGLYYIKGGIHTAQASGGSFPCLRPGPPTGGDGSGGTVFYLADAGSVAINANCNEDRVDTFPRAQLSCPGVAAPSYFPGTTEGVVLLGPCQAPTVQSLCDPNCNLVFYNNQRGILFFQNRASDAATLQVQDDEDWVLGGAIYFHQCVTSGVDTGIGCSTSAYNDSVTLLSGGGQGTVFGTIIADQISLTGPLTVDLNSTVTYPTLKATLLQ
ncbi:MAG: hypothetical protein JO356_11490, partial [Acidobacteria bacterium]|nr:hypothetical protein [Acidobacteriota bacterium]